MAGDARYPVKFGRVRFGRTVTTALAVLPAARALAPATRAGFAPGAAGKPGAGSATGAAGEPGGSTPGVTSAMFATLPGGADASTRKLDVEADALAGLQARDHEAAPAADATQLAVGAHERHPARDAIADPDVAGAATAAVADGDPVAREAAGSHRRAVGLLVDHHVATWRTRAVTRSDTHVVEQVATTGEGRGPRHAGAELQAVDGRGRIAVRRWCLLRSGAVVVLPRREALTKVTTVDGDSHQVVVQARVDLDPEPDRVRTAAAKQRARVRDELAIDVGGVVDADPNTVRECLPGPPRTCASPRRSPG